MHRVLSRDQIRSFDRIAIEDCHVPGVVLMENAGRGAAETIQSLITDETDHVLVVCGTGNNGGDGFVVARHLLSAGESVSVCLLGDPSKLRGDALVNHEAFVGLDGHVVIVDDEGSLPVLETELLRAGLVVDAIFGTGLDREIRGRFAQAIDRMNATAATRVALDLPSGLDANTGTVLGTAVVADTTITFGALKLGLLTPTGSRLAGDIHVAALGVSPAILDETGHVAEILIASRLQSMVERLRTQARIIEDAPVGIVVSDEGSVWAARLALRACRRTAPGPVRLLPSRKALGSVQDLAAEALIEPWDAKQGVKSLAKAWAGCGSLVFPSVDPNELGAVEKARASFEGLLVAAAAPTLGAKTKRLNAKGGEAALIVDAAALGSIAGSNAHAAASDRFQTVQAAVDAAEAVVVLADEQPIVGVPNTAMGVLGQRADILDSPGMRAVMSGAVGRFGVWADAGVAALAGLHVTSAAVGKWLEDHEGRGGPLAQEIADRIVSVL